MEILLYKVEYSLSGCRYIDMFETYGIRDVCHDEVIRKRRSK